MTSQLLSWNPTIHTNCDNLGSMVGRSICVSPPGSTEWDAAPSTTSRSSTVTFVVPSTSFGTIPAQTAVPNRTTSYFVNTILPNITTTAMTANATAESLLAQRTGYCPFNSSDYAAGLSIYDMPGNCSDLLEPYCFPDPDAPILTSTTFPALCSPAAALNIPDTTSGGSAATLTVGSTAASNTAASSISSTAAPTQTGIASTCARYYTVQSGDSCQGIVDKYAGEFTLSDLYGWNPAVGSGCSSLRVGYAVCVGIPSTPTIPPSPSSVASSSTSTSSPVPIQTGIVTTCDRYYTVQSGDTCQGIVNKYNGAFTLSDFYSWNPVVGTGCTLLWVGKCYLYIPTAIRTCPLMFGKATLFVSVYLVLQRRMAVGQVQVRSVAFLNRPPAGRRLDLLLRHTPTEGCLRIKLPSKPRLSLGDSLCSAHTLYYDQKLRITILFIRSFLTSGSSSRGRRSQVSRVLWA